MSKKYIFKSSIFAKILCFLSGHKPYRFNYKNVDTLRLNRKGGKKKSKVVKIKTKHCREICTRCGLILKKR